MRPGSRPPKAVGRPGGSRAGREWFSCMGKVAQGRLNHQAGRPREACRVELAGCQSCIRKPGSQDGALASAGLPHSRSAQATSPSSAARGQRGRRNPCGNVHGRGAQAARAGGTAAWAQQGRTTGDPRTRAAERSHFRFIFFLAAAGMRSWVSGGAAAPSGGPAAGSRSPGRALARACHRGLGRIARIGGGRPPPHPDSVSSGLLRFLARGPGAVAPSGRLDGLCCAMPAG